MRILITILLIILINSCNNKDSHNKYECKNLTGINDSLYYVILSYQKINPIPIVRNSTNDLPPTPETAFKYVYEVQFKKEKDTIIIITLRPDGINLIYNNFRTKLYGVYQDSCLRPTYFIGDSSLSKNFVRNYTNKDIANFRYDNSSTIDFFYSGYVYKIIGERLVFKEKIKGNIGE